MNEFTLQTELWLSRPRTEVFPFFAEVTPAPIAMRQGTFIDYRIRVHGLPIRWRTEVTEWQPPHRFVDIQL